MQKREMDHSSLAGGLQRVHTVSNIMLPHPQLHKESEAMEDVQTPDTIVETLSEEMTDSSIAPLDKKQVLERFWTETTKNYYNKLP